MIRKVILRECLAQTVALWVPGIYAPIEGRANRGRVDREGREDGKDLRLEELIDGLPLHRSELVIVRSLMPRSAIAGSSIS